MKRRMGDGSGVGTRISKEQQHSGVDRKRIEEIAMANSSLLCAKHSESIGRHRLVLGSLLFLDATPGLIPEGHPYLT